MSETILTRQLDINGCPELDSMPMDQVGDYLEQKAQKHFIDCRNWSERYPYHPLTIFTIARTGRYIYVDYFVRCNYLRAVNYTDNSPVADDSCVEFFLKVPGSDEYWNLEFNCIGTVNASHRVTRPAPTRLTGEEIASIKRYASCGTRPFEEMEGLFAWNLTVGVPLELVGLDPANLPEYIWGNFYKCAGKTGLPHFLSWSPIVAPEPDFHRPEFFGKLYLR